MYTSYYCVYIPCSIYYNNQSSYKFIMRSTIHTNWLDICVYYVRPCIINKNVELQVCTIKIGT